MRISLLFLLFGMGFFFSLLFNRSRIGPVSVIYAPLLFVIIMIRIQAVPTEALLLLLTHELLKYFFVVALDVG